MKMMRKPTLKVFFGVQWTCYQMMIRSYLRQVLVLLCFTYADVRKLSVVTFITVLSDIDFSLLIDAIFFFSLCQYIFVPSYPNRSRYSLNY